MPSFVIILLAILSVYIIVFTIFFFILDSKVTKVEKEIIANFLLKVSKIPGLIEVMRPFVADEAIFANLTKLHSAAMIHEYETIYVLLEHNARIYEEFTFLMKLAVQIPTLQKNAEFLYIRDFIMKYEKNMKNDFMKYDVEAEKWNRFVTIKNMTIIGLLLPGKRKELI